MSSQSIKVAFDLSILEKIGNLGALSKAANAEARELSKQIDAASKKGIDVDKATLDRFKQIEQIKDSTKKQMDEIKDIRQNNTDNIRRIHSITRLSGKGLLGKVLKGERIDATDVSNILHSVKQAEKPILNIAGRFLSKDSMSTLKSVGAALPYVNVAIEVLSALHNQYKEYEKRVKEYDDIAKSYDKKHLTRADVDMYFKTEGDRFLGVFGKSGAEALQETKEIKESFSKIDDINKERDVFNNAVRNAEIDERFSHFNNWDEMFNKEKNAETLKLFKQEVGTFDRKIQKSVQSEELRVHRDLTKEEKQAIVDNAVNEIIANLATDDKTKGAKEKLVEALKKEVKNAEEEKKRNKTKVEMDIENAKKASASFLMENLNKETHARYGVFRVPASFSD